MEIKYKIFVDFNNSDSSGRVRLNTRGTIDDIHRLNIQLKEGIEILLNDDEGLEIPGTVEFSEQENIWVAKMDRIKLMN